MPDDAASDADRVGRAFRVALDKEGYSFHHAVLRRCEAIALQLTRTADNRLTFEVSEFPVQTKGRDTRIDFILKITSTWQTPAPMLLVCESKRANPAFADWCFARAPYTDNRGSPRVIADALAMDEHGNWFPSAVRLSSAEAPYHIGLPVKGAGVGDAADRGSAREAIEDAAGQVMRGLNGLADFMYANPQMLSRRRTLLLPVIFTTAALYTSEVPLAEAVLETGKLAMDRVEVQPRDWLWYQYHVSSSLRHSISSPVASKHFGSLGDMLGYEHSRSIAIVSVTGIERFLHSIGSLADSVSTL